MQQDNSTERQDTDQPCAAPVESQLTQYPEHSTRNEPPGEPSPQTGGTVCGDPEHARSGATRGNTANVPALRAAAHDFAITFETALHALEDTRQQLQERTEQVNGLTLKIEEVTTSLNAELQSARELQEAHVREREALNRDLEELREQHNIALKQIESRGEELDARDQQLAELRSRLGERDHALEQQAAVGRKLQEERALETASLTARIDELTGSLQQLKARLHELEEHSSKIEQLNASLHETSLSEAELYRRQTEARAREVADLSSQVEVLSAALREAGENRPPDPGDRRTVESQQRQIEELKSHLQAAEAGSEKLRAAAGGATALAEMVEKLSADLRESRQGASRNNADKETIKTLQAQVTKLTTALELAEARSTTLQSSCPDASQEDARLQELTAALLRSEQVLQQTDDCCAEPVTYLRDGRPVYANPAYVRMLCSANAESPETPFIAEYVAEEQKDDFCRFLHHDSEGPPADNAPRFDLRLPGGETVTAGIHPCRITIGGTPCTRLVIRMDAGNSESAPLPVATDNPETPGCVYDREYFIRNLEQTLETKRSEETHRAVMYILLDNFMKIREEIGIVHSEQVVKDIGSLLKSKLGDPGLLARFGECVFTILHSSDGMDGLLNTAEQLRGLVEAHLLEVGEHSTLATVSIGVCAINDHTRNAQDILTRADLACEIARSSGGNRVHMHSTIIDEQILRDNDQSCGRLVADALESDRLYIVYQPIGSLGEQQGRHYAALLRILDEQGNVILPGEFIAIAARTGLVTRIDRFVIEAAFKALSRDENRGIVLFIKLSAASVADADLAVWILKKLKEYKIDNGQIVFAITEKVIESDLQNSVRLSKALHAMHCKVAVEHYTGMTEPEYLTHLRADFVKIDGKLSCDLDKSQENRIRVAEIIDLAGRNDIPTVAERVEDAASLAVLWDLGVSFAQGNFVREPCPALDYDFYGDITSGSLPHTRAIFKTE
jgi:diguanylate cyclase (GGDEF)-like protein